MAGEEEFYIGKRLSYDGALCTVRYHGSLGGTLASWLGVEWDDTSRGKHDGTYRGQQIFSCLSSSKTAASFVRPTRPSDKPRIFLEALRFKYGGEKDASRCNRPVEISGKAVEEIGFEKIRRQQAELQDLRVAVLDELQLSGILGGSPNQNSLKCAQDNIARTCPNIVELDLGWSLLERWQDVADICRPLTKLRILRVSGVRLHSFSVEKAGAAGGPFAGVQELYLNETLLRPAQLAEMLNQHFQQLKILSLAQNELDSLTPAKSDSMLYIPSVASLVLEKNTFRDLSSTKCLSNAFPNLKELSFQQNNIDSMGGLDLVEMSKYNMFSGLNSLNLSGNKITDFAFVDQLSLLFPNLTSLRVSNNPLYAQMSAVSPATLNIRSDLPFSFVLARIPSLIVLNHTTISTRDREEGEIYYLSAAGKEILELLEASDKSEGAGDTAQKIKIARAKHPRYEALCAKYERDSVFEQYATNIVTRSNKPSSKSAPGSLAARLLEARFYVPNSSDKSLHRSIARTIEVYRVKALISREMRLRPLQFRLTYESEELDPVRDGVEQKSSDWEAWGDWNVDGDVDSDIESKDTREQARAETWINGVLLRDGKKWKKREIEIMDGTRAWGDYIGDEEIRTVNIRVEPYNTV